MKRSVIYLFLLFFTVTIWTACSKQTVDPNFTGSIEGQVQNSETGEPISGASISTNPGTSAILTDEEGKFIINDISTGNYTVQADKDGFTSKTVRVTVKENKAATAQILLKTDDAQPSSNFIMAEVTSFTNTSRNDSTFAEVSYLVKNMSESQKVRKFEVYFKIFTPGTIYYSEIKGDTLDSGQQSVGEFKKYIRKNSADSVVVSGFYAPNP